MIILNNKTTDNKLLITKTCQILNSGGLVIVPSDTVYGLAVDATNKSAVQKLIQFKKRPPGKAISVFVGSLKQTEEIVVINKNQRSTLEQILPGPFTVVLPSKHVLVKNLESEKGTLGIRIPQFDFVNKLVQAFRKPITATSANISGQSYHYSIKSLLETLPEKKKELLDLVIDFGKLPRNKPSTVIDLSEGKLKILRQGDLNLKSTQRFISKTPEQTKKIAQFLLNKYIVYTNKRLLVFLIEGELGVGKTIFVKGIGKELGINNIISPSFVVCYEYNVKNEKVNNLYHLDFYMVEQAEELRYLGIEQMLKPRMVVCVEWGERIGEVFDLLRRKGKVIYIKMSYINEHTREIAVNF